MSNKVATYFPRGINCYVPQMQYAEEMVPDGTLRVSLGSPPAASAAGILSATSIATAGSTTTFLAGTSMTDDTMGIYGRNLTVVASGAATSNVTVYGEDYVGQPMAQSFTLNGTTAVTGTKAFKRITRVTFGATGGTTINLGYGDRLGLPFVSTSVIREFADNVLQAAGTFVAPIFTDPQTLTTGDPRGTYDPTVALTGTVVVEVDLRVTDYVNASNNGGLHGIAHVVA